MPDRGGIAGSGDTCHIVVDQIAVGVGLDAGPDAESAELARVRRQHGGSSLALPPAVHRGERAQRLRVQHDRRSLLPARVEQHPDELGGRETRPQAGADHQCVMVVIEDPRQRGLRIHLLDVVLGQRHRRRLDDLRGEQRLERLGHGQRDEARPRRGRRRGTRAARPPRSRAIPRRTSSLPNEPLWPRSGRSGRSATAVSSSSLATPSGQGRSSVDRVARPTPSARRPNPTGRRSVTVASRRHPGRRTRAPRPRRPRRVSRSRSMRARIRRSRSSSRSSMSGGNR